MTRFDIKKNNIFLNYNRNKKKGQNDKIIPTFLSQTQKVFYFFLAISNHFTKSFGSSLKEYHGAVGTPFSSRTT